MSYEVTYPPLDTLKAVADNVWIVDSGPHRMLGLPMPVRMTVLRDGNGRLLLHSPTRYTPGLAAELAAIGEIRHLVAPNSAHWSYVREWHRHAPDATPWGVPALLRRSSVRSSPVPFRTISEPGIAGFDDTDVLIVPAGEAFQEAVLWHRPSRTLVLTDLVVNVEAGKLPPLLRPAAYIAGVTAPDGRAPIYLRTFIMLHRREARRAAERLLALDVERVIFSHGLWFEKDAQSALRRSLSWLVG
jgi:hypothetical protein